MTENELSTIIIGCAIEVHRRLGAGLLERAYQECLNVRIKTKRFKKEKKVTLPITYKELK